MIETPRLHLRPFRDDDLQAYASIWAKPEVVRFLPTESDTTRALETAASFIRAWGEASWAEGYSPWAVVDRTTERLVGHCGLRFAPSVGAAELVYLLDSDVWGRGYASEAAQAACAFGRDRLALDYIIAVALADNAGSVAVLRKVGFTFEGETEKDGLQVVRYGRKL